MQHYVRYPHTKNLASNILAFSFRQAHYGDESLSSTTLLGPHDIICCYKNLYRACRAKTDELVKLAGRGDGRHRIDHVLCDDTVGHRHHQVNIVSHEVFECEQVFIGGCGGRLRTGSDLRPGRRS